MWRYGHVLVILVSYAAIVALMYATQTQMRFPTWLARASNLRLPASTRRLEVETLAGERLRGVHVRPAHARAGERLVVLGFGGNAWNADPVAAYLHGLFSDTDVVAFHYRGYRPSTGKPSATALLADAPVVYQHILETVGTRRQLACYPFVAGEELCIADITGYFMMNMAGRLELDVEGEFPNAHRWHAALAARPSASASA